MKKLLFLILLLFLFPINTFAISDTARSTIVMDIDSGRVLYEKNADEARLVASITKIMTAVIAIENGNLDDIVTVGEEVLSMYGSNIYIELGEKMTLRNLLYGLLLRSGNDAAIVIATHISGSEEKFIELMNQKAQSLGMKNTIYRNSHGLDEYTKNYSSARDMALLSSYAYKLDEYREISSTKKWTVQSDKKSYAWNNRNKLLYNYKYATGGKNGYTPSAGRTLVTTANKNNLNLTIVTLNDANEYVTHESLYEYCFNKYKNFLIVDRNNFDIDDNFLKNKVYINKSFIYPLSSDEENKINMIIKINTKENYKNNDKVGEVIVTLENEEIFREDVFVSLDKKTNKSFLEKIKLFIRNLFAK